MKQGQIVQKLKAAGVEITNATLSRYKSAGLLTEFGERPTERDIKTICAEAYAANKLLQILKIKGEKLAEIRNMALEVEGEPVHLAELKNLQELNDQKIALFWLIYREKYLQDLLDKEIKDFSITVNKETGEIKKNLVVEGKKAIRRVSSAVKKIKSNVETERETLEVKHIAKILGVHSHTAYDLVHKDEFPSFRIGKKILVNKTKFYEWLDKQGLQKEEKAEV